MTGLDRRHVVVVVAIAAVGTAVVIGLVRLGPPSEERSRRLDEQRIEDLGRLARSVDLHWTRDGSLPLSLGTLSDAAVPGARFSDPGTSQPYDYRVLGDSTFELCGHFETDWSARSSDEFWSHPPGRFCFELDVREVRRRGEQQRSTAPAVDQSRNDTGPAVPRVPAR